MQAAVQNGTIRVMMISVSIRQQQRRLVEQVNSRGALLEKTTVNERTTRK